MAYTCRSRRRAAAAGAAGSEVNKPTANDRVLFSGLTICPFSRHRFKYVLLRLAFVVQELSGLPQRFDHRFVIEFDLDQVWVHVV